MAQEIGWKHRYHAEATAVEGHLRLPIKQPIERQAHAKVPEHGGYVSQHSDDYRVEGIVSYSAAHTQVAGHKDDKPGHGYTTLATSVIENLNVLNVVTADRVVGQVSIEHPLEGYIPSITFLGTHFYNLRIAGKPVEVDLDLDFIGEKPEGDRSYTRHQGFMDRVANRLGIVRAHVGLPEEIATRYKDNLCPIENGECTEFSLVRGIEGKFPGKSYGHVLDIPHFGKVYLAVVCIHHKDAANGGDTHRETLIDLKMLDIRMGCLASGTVTIGTAKTNGGSTPGSG